MAKRAINFVYTRKPPPARVQFQAWRTNVQGRLRKVGEAHVASRRRAVANWSARSRPDFSAKIQVNLFLISVEVRVKEADRKRPIWKWVDETGTKPHTIRARRKGGRLAFQWGGPGSYLAKTKAHPARYGGPGVVANGQLTVRESVQHPGFEPRKISDQINRDLEPMADKELDNASRQEAKRDADKV